MSSQFRASLYAAISWSLECDRIRLIITRFVMTRQIASVSAYGKEQLLVLPHTAGKV